LSNTSKTQGWFAVGMGLIILGGAIYGLLMLFGVGFALRAASAEIEGPLWAVLLIPGLMAFGFLILLAKVVVDRLNNAEDDHYSKNVDK